jgi:hypothetical protein
VVAKVIWATATGSLLTLAMVFVLAPRPEDRRDSALCAEVDPDTFPERGDSTHATKGICRRCLVKASVSGSQ